MERLTGRDAGHFSMIRGKVVERLAAYEDTGLEPKEIHDIINGCRGIYDSDQQVTLFGKTLNEWLRIAEAEEQGRLLVLPCKVGDGVYHLSAVWARGVILRQFPHYVEQVPFDPITMWDFLEEMFKPHYFLTREEAEKALNKTVV